MSTLLHVLGGAAQGIGAGMVLQGQAASAAAERETSRRHEVALENLRNQNQQGNIRLQSDLGDRNASRDDERGDLYDARQTQRRTASQITTDNNRGTIEERQQDRQFQQRVTLTEIEHGNAIERERVQATLRRGDAEFERSLTAGDVVDTMEGSDGFYYYRKRDGSTVRSSVGVAPSAATGGSVLSQARGVGAAATSSPPAASAAPAPAAAPSGGGGNNRLGVPVPDFGRGAGQGAARPQPGQVVDGYRFKGGDPANQANWERAR